MSSDRRRATVFIASGFGVAAAVGAGVWWASSPTTNDVASTSTETSVTAPEETSSNSASTPESSSTNAHSAQEGSSGYPSMTLPSQTLLDEPRATPTHVAPPRADDPFLPPNALLAAPQPIERETMVYRPSNIMPTPADEQAARGDDAILAEGAQTPEAAASETAPEGAAATSPGAAAPGTVVPQASEPTAASATPGAPGTVAPSTATSTPAQLPESTPDGTPDVPALGEILPTSQVPSVPTTVEVPEVPQLSEVPDAPEAPEAPAPQPEPEVQQGATPGLNFGSLQSSTPWWQVWRDRIFS